MELLAIASPASMPAGSAKGRRAVPDGADGTTIELAQAAGTVDAILIGAPSRTFGNSQPSG